MRLAERRGVRWYATLVVCVAVLSVSGRASADYAYTEHFFDDKAMSDSYYHSTWLDTVPMDVPDGSLVYIDSSWVPNRLLRFCRGTSPEGRAHLQYQFPLEGVMPNQCRVGITMTMVETEMEVSLLELWGSTDIDSWSCWMTMFMTMYCEVSLPVSEGSSYVRLWFKGEDAMLDNFEITLTSDTPVGDNSWGRIKAMYRD